MKKIFKKIALAMSIALTALSMGVFSGCSLLESILGGGQGNSASTSSLPEEQEVTLELDLMSFNIRTMGGDTGTRSWDNRKDNVVSYLNESGADVICMQEVVTAQYQYLSTGLADKYEIVHYERQGAGSEGLAIAYDKAEFELLDKRMFWLSDTPDKMSLGWGASYYRICVNVFLQHKETGAYLDVYDVHLDHQVKAARINGINLIMEKAEDRNCPKVMAGDFNDVSGSDCYEEIFARMKDCQLYADETDVGTTWHDWGAIADDARDSIDFCFVSDEIQPLTFEICRDKTANGQFYSDHYAIKSKVRMIVE